MKKVKMEVYIGGGRGKTLFFQELHYPRCQFHQHFMYEFFVLTSFWQLILVTFWLWQKIRTKNARI